MDDNYYIYFEISAWAIKRGFHTAKGAKLDIYRAANHLLRLIVQGRFNLCLRPPKYSEEIGNYHNFI